MDLGRLKLFALLVTVLFASPAKASTVVVGTVLDTFDLSPQSVNLDYLTAPPTRYASSVAIGPASSILGTERELELEVTANPGLQASVNVLPILGGVLNINNGAGVVSTATVTWDGVGTGSLSVDLTRGGMDDLIALDLVSVDQSAEVTFSIEDVGGDIATLTRSGLSAGFELYHFADFSNLAATDFTNVKSVRMTVTGPEGVDLNLDLFGSGHVEVPSPTGGAALASLIGCGLLTQIRRRRD